MNEEKDPFLQTLKEWSELCNKIEAIKPDIERERALRSMIMAVAFPQLTEPCREYMAQTGTDEHRPGDCKCLKEGTNTLELAGGWKLKGQHKIDRKVDKAALPAVMEQVQKQFMIGTDRFIREVPELVVKEYRTLTKEQRKVFDQALIVKPAAPALELVPPKNVP